MRVQSPVCDLRDGWRSARSKRLSEIMVLQPFHKDVLACAKSSDGSTMHLCL